MWPFVVVFFLNFLSDVHPHALAGQGRTSPLHVIDLSQPISRETTERAGARGGIPDLGKVAGENSEAKSTASGVSASERLSASGSLGVSVSVSESVNVSVSPIVTGSVSWSATGTESASANETEED